jgi:hypothetical protein
MATESHPLSVVPRLLNLTAFHHLSSAFSRKPGQLQNRWQSACRLPQFIESRQRRRPAGPNPGLDAANPCWYICTLFRKRVSCSTCPRQAANCSLHAHFYLRFPQKELTCAISCLPKNLGCDAVRSWQLIPYQSPVKKSNNSLATRIFPCIAPASQPTDGRYWENRIGP